MTGPQPKFDKEIELKKIDLVSEEIRNRYFMALGAYFAILIAMIAAAFEIAIQSASSGTIPVYTTIGLVVVFPFVTWTARRSIKRYKHIFLKFQPLLNNIGDEKSNGSLENILKELQKSTTSKES